MATDLCAQAAASESKVAASPRRRDDKTRERDEYILVALCSWGEMGEARASRHSGKRVTIDSDTAERLRAQAWDGQRRWHHNANNNLNDACASRDMA